MHLIGVYWIFFPAATARATSCDIHEKRRCGFICASDLGGGFSTLASDPFPPSCRLFFCVTGLQ